MKKGLLSMALILIMVLNLILFPRNKAEAYYGGYYYGGFPGSYATYSGLSGGYGAYGSSYAAYGGLYGMYGGLMGGLYGMYGGFFSPISTKEGTIIIPTRVYEPSPPIPSTYASQNKRLLGLLNIFPDIMPPLGTGPISYPAFPADTEWLWPDFKAMPSSPPIFTWTPAFPSIPYWPDFYTPIPYPTSPRSIPIPM